MEKITVYNYEAFSITAGKTINHGTFATMEFITKSKLTAVIEKRLEVPPSSIDPDGRYIPNSN